VAAACTPVAVTPLGRRARPRPPVVVPERIAAALAAPGAPARRQRCAAPRAAVGLRARERAAGE
jgi:hypothetical protein